MSCGTCDAGEDCPIHGGDIELRRPRLLDAFCRKGGAGMGYIRAGFDVVGVDIEDHSDGYPGTFVQGDAVEYVREHGHEFDAVHLSPPCQGQIAITAGNRGRRGWTDSHVNLLPAAREAAAFAGRPSVMENGPSRHIRKDIVLCGEMFGLGVIRHRAFELGGWTMPKPAHLPHRGRVRGWRHGEYFDGPYLAVYGDGGGKPSIPEAQAAMGIDWMTERVDLNEAIPPAYTQLIGKRLLEHLTAARAA